MTKFIQNLEESEENSNTYWEAGIQKETKEETVLAKYKEADFIESRLNANDQEEVREWRRTREAWKVIEFARVDKLLEVMKMLKVPYLYTHFKNSGIDCAKI